MTYNSPRTESHGILFKLFRYKEQLANLGTSLTTGTLFSVYLTICGEGTCTSFSTVMGTCTRISTSLISCSTVLTSTGTSTSCKCVYMCVCMCVCVCVCVCVCDCVCMRKCRGCSSPAANLCTHNQIMKAPVEVKTVDEHPRHLRIHTQSHTHTQETNILDIYAYTHCFHLHWRFHYLTVCA